MSATDGRTAWSPFVVAVAPTGARRTKRDHPALPITPQEIARDACACLEVGAAMLHLHVRDRDGAHTLDADAYRAAIAAVEAEVGDRLMIQVTTEAAGQFSPAEQMASVRAVKPEAVSIAVRELFPEGGDERDAAAFLEWCRRERIAVQYILYDRADHERLRTLMDRGVVPGDRVFRLYVLGRYTGGTGAEPTDLLPFLADDDGDGAWAVCAFGAKETACAATAAALGGHARVGFENNLQLPDGTVADSNADLVGVTVNLARGLGRPIGDAAFLRSATEGWA